jgi:hypothetical protein
VFDLAVPRSLRFMDEDERQRMRILALHGVWRAAEAAYRAELGQFFSVADATQPVGEAGVRVDRVMDQSVVARLIELHQDVQKALSDWHGALLDRQYGSGRKPARRPARATTR